MANLKSHRVIDQIGTETETLLPIGLQGQEIGVRAMRNFRKYTMKYSVALSCKMCQSRIIALNYHRVFSLFVSSCKALKYKKEKLPFQ